MASEDIVELHAEIARLNEEVKRRDDALHQAKVAYWRWSSSTGRLKYSPREFFAVLGVPTDQAIDTYDADRRYLHPDDLARVTATYDQADSNAEDFEVTYRMLEADGTIRSVHETGKAEFDDAGGFLGHLGIVQDITERKEAEEALKESQEIFQQIADAAPMVISVKDREGRFLFANRYLAETIGKDQSEIHGKRARDLLAPEAAAQVEAVDQLVFQSGAVLPFYEEKIVVHGQTHAMLATKVPIRGSDDSLKFVATIGLDISERKAIEEALEESERRFRDFTEAASDWFWEQDEHLRFTYFSDRHEAVTGLSDRDVLNRTREEIFGRSFQDEEPQWQKHFANLAARQNFRDFAYSFRRSDGDVRVLRASGIAVFDQAGVFQGYRGVGADITKEVEERRRREAAEASLRQAQKMESIGQMTGGVAHDFNNLLAVIQGNVELLLENSGGDAPMLKAIERASRRGAELIQRMLAFSRKQALYPKAFDLDERVEQMLQLLHRTLGEAIEIQFDPRAEGWRCLADEGQVDNALLNLALNARDAMPNGGKLKIRTRQVKIVKTDPLVAEDLTPGDYLLLTVSDSGTGIAREDLQNVFEPFFTTKEFGRGSGLGLSMIYGFAKQSGGHVSLESIPGRGTRARLYLPRALCAPLEREREPPPSVPSARGETVLVVEDKEDVRDLIVALLARLGYRASAASHGEEALNQLAADTNFDLLLSDVVLPGGISGPHLARKARQADPNLGVLLMSGYQGSALGPDTPGIEDWPLIRKPFRQEELALALRQVLDSGPAEELAKKALP